MRLTNKNRETNRWTQLEDNYFPTRNIKHKQCVNKLGQLEDLEEDLGIDLITLFKALKNGIWVKTKKFNGFIEPTHLRIAGDIKDPFSSRTVLVGLKLISYRDSVVILARNYGKHWALTKEELL